MQQYFVQAFDRTDPQAHINTAITHTQNLLQQARNHRVPVVYTAQKPHQKPHERGLLTDFWGTGLTADGSDNIIPELTPHTEDVLLTKWRYSAFSRTDLLEHMRAHGRDQLIITGIYAHIGCLTTALVAFMEDIQAFIVPEATADFSADEHHHALKYAATRCANVKPANQLVDELHSSARTPAHQGAL